MMHCDNGWRTDGQFCIEPRQLVGIEGTVTVSSFQVAGDTTVYTAGQTANISGVGTLVINSGGSYTFTITSSGGAGSVSGAGSIPAGSQAQTVAVSNIDVSALPAGTLTLSVGYALFFGNVVLVPLWLQQFMGYTSTDAGMVMAPVGLLALVLSPVVGKTIARVDARRYATFAFLVFALVLWMRSHFSTQTDFGSIMVPTIIQGVAMAFFFIPLITITMSGLTPERVAAASGLSNFVRITFGAVGTSVATTLWESRAAMHHAHLAEAVHTGNPVAQTTLQGLGLLPEPAPPAGTVPTPPPETVATADRPVALAGAAFQADAGKHAMDRAQFQSTVAQGITVANGEPDAADFASALHVEQGLGFAWFDGVEWCGVSSLFCSRRLK